MIRYETTPDSPSFVLITAACSECKEESTMRVPLEAFFAWKRGKHIQDAMPMLSEDERELLISGMCGKCFDALFEDEE